MSMSQWRVIVTVVRAPGRDAKGRPLGPPEEFTLEGCLFGPRATRDPVDRSDLTESTGVLYAPAGADLRAADQVRIPGNGTWALDGDPQRWPLGTEVPIRKEGA